MVSRWTGGLVQSIQPRCTPPKSTTSATQRLYLEALVNAHAGIAVTCRAGEPEVDGTVAFGRRRLAVDYWRFAASSFITVRWTLKSNGLTINNSMTELSG